MARDADPFLSRAVLIGTGRYNRLTEIRAVHNNLAALAEVLRADRFWGLPLDGCAVVEDPSTTAEMLDPVVAAAQSATDTLLLYYAGHGLVDPRRSELHLALPDSDPQRIYTAVPYALVRDILLDSSAIRRVVILDCCYSGRALGQMATLASAVADEASAEGTYVLAASAENKAALAPQGERYTAFTGELLGIIRDGIGTCGPMLDLDSLYRHLLATMRSKGLPIPQKRDRNTAGQLTLIRNQAYRQSSAGLDLSGVARADELSGRQAGPGQRSGGPVVASPHPDNTADLSAALPPTADRGRPSIERALMGPGSRRDTSWRRQVKVVTGGQGPGRDLEALDRERARLPLAGPRRMVVLGCTEGAGQTVTVLMTGSILAEVRGSAVAALDLNPGPNSLAVRRAPALSVRALLVGQEPGEQAKGPAARLDVIADPPFPSGANPLQTDDYQRLADLVAERYPLTMIDPAASGLNQVLSTADQLLLVAPASPEAATALANTQRWLGAHGHSELADRAVTVINGVSKRTMEDVLRTESVARGRCRAIVRIPWDDHLSSRPGASTTLNQQTRIAYTALAGVLVAGLAADPTPRSRKES